ncbi:MAG: FprA family A-type flavoprotein [Desulfuromonadales bacterium]
MASVVEIRPNLHYVGSKHPQLKIFDELFPTRNGTTYNSFLLRGAEKTVLIDTVKAPFAGDLLGKLDDLGVQRLDYIVVNHTEPDHTGALGDILRRFPEAIILCTRPGHNFLWQIFNLPLKTQVVADGDEIDLGGRTLRFFLAPNLHWPDTMFSYLPEERILFSCDAFGAHFCDDGLYNDEVSDFQKEFAFYFDSIMRPFKDKVREAVAKIKDLPIDMVCPSHGPLLRHHPKAAINAYKNWSQPPSNGKKVLLLTLSPHGNTRDMAAFVRQGLESRGLEVAERAIIELPPQDLRDLLEETDALVVATPTINRDAPPPIWQNLALLSSVTPRGKIGAVFGSYGWSGEAVKLVEERLSGLKYKLAVPGLLFRFKPTEEDNQACRQFGEKIGDFILQQ